MTRVVRLGRRPIYELSAEPFDDWEMQQPIWQASHNSTEAGVSTISEQSTDNTLDDSTMAGTDEPSIGIRP